MSTLQRRLPSGAGLVPPRDPRRGDAALAHLPQSAADWLPINSASVSPIHMPNSDVKRRAWLEEVDVARCQDNGCGCPAASVKHIAGTKRNFAVPERRGTGTPNAGRHHEDSGLPIALHIWLRSGLKAAGSHPGRPVCRFLTNEHLCKEVAATNGNAYVSAGPRASPATSADLKKRCNGSADGHTWQALAACQ
jgi:hypothetical protein